MKYIVLHHPDHGYEAVKDGYSFTAFFFGIFWMIYKRMWPYAMGAFLTYAILGSLLTVLQDFAFFIPEHITRSFAYSLGLVYGLYGNKWRVSNLEQQGYKRIGSCDALTEEEAIEHSKLTERSIAMLPALLLCPQCSTEQELGEQERRSGELTCPSCENVTRSVVAEPPQRVQGETDVHGTGWKAPAWMPVSLSVLGFVLILMIGFGLSALDQQQRDQAFEWYKGSAVSMETSGCTVYYDGSATEEQAHLVGRLLETMQYFVQGRKARAKLEEKDGHYTVILEMDRRLWDEASVANWFDAMIHDLERHFQTDVTVRVVSHTLGRGTEAKTFFKRTENEDA